MEWAPQGETWLDDTQMALNWGEKHLSVWIDNWFHFQYFITLRISSGKSASYYPLLCVARSVEKMAVCFSGKLLCLLSEDTHLCALIPFIRCITENNKRGLCICPQMCWSIHYVFIYVQKRCPPKIISVFFFTMLLFFYLCIILKKKTYCGSDVFPRQKDIQPLHVSFIVHQQICIDWSSLPVCLYLFDE